MSEESKYYTPKVDEFCVGFEYEVANGFLDGTTKTKEQFDSAMWSKKVFTVADGPYIERALTGSNFLNGLFGIGVKYLNQEDIESLGWEIDFNGWFVSEKHELIYDYKTKSLIIKFIKGKSGVFLIVITAKRRLAQIYVFFQDIAKTNTNLNASWRCCKLNDTKYSKR